MDEHIRLILVVGVVALCAIVGIYYCAVREKILARRKTEEGIRVALSRPEKDVGPIGVPPVKD